jgi:uncharacterized protein involved in exopolysaccharide biosynthesis
VFTKILETFFRHSRVILAPALLIPAIVVPTAWFTAPVYYEAVASVWAGTPPVPVGSQDEAVRYLTPAQAQTAKLSAMLRTRWMRDAIAGRTSAAPLIGTQAGEDTLQRMVEKDLTITTTGNDLLSLKFRGSSSELAQQFLQAVIDTYKDKASTDSASAGAVASSFYQDQLQDAQAALDNANRDLRRYLAAHPEYASSGAGAPAALADPTLATLQNNVQYSQKLLEDAKAAAQQAELKAAAALDAQDAAFEVIDPPVAAVRPTRDIKTLIIFPAAALVLGLGLSSLLLVLLVSGDRTARDDADLAALGLRVLANVPQVQLARSRGLPEGLATGHAARRAIGFIASNALPAPSGAQ